jgi:hypothetical protein
MLRSAPVVGFAVLKAPTADATDRDMNGILIPQLLTLKEFSEHSRLSESTIRRRARDGSLPVVQVGGKGKKLLFPVDALKRLHAFATSTTSDDTVDLSPLTPATGVRTDTRAGPRPRWVRNLPRRPK